MCETNVTIQSGFLFFLLLGVFSFVPLAADEGPAFDRRWLLLLHYRQQGGGYKSDVADESFFLSENGRLDPSAEYDRARKLFIERPDPAAINRFPLRYRFVCAAEKTEVDESLFNEDVRRIDALARRVRDSYLVFASDYKTKPESMFGHTLLCFDSGEAEYLALSVGYAANAGDAGNMEFFVKGMSGGFPGNYELLPYFYKIKEYNMRDGRDLWEYRLNLSPEEIRCVLEHLHEMSQGTEPYYFFSENCSYALVYLLALARPSSPVLQKLAPWVIPLDTVRAADKTGFIVSSHYRPSSATIVERWSGILDREAFAAGVFISDNTDAAAELLQSSRYSDTQKAQILDFAMDYYVCKTYPRLSAPDEIRSFEMKAIELARYRSRVATSSTEMSFQSEDPLASHKPLRFRLGGGYGNALPFAQISARIAYHAYDDPLYGFMPASELVVGELQCRVYDPLSEPVVSLEEFTIARIAAMNRINRDQFPLAWRFSTAVGRNRPFDEQIAWNFKAESGLAAGGRTLLVYVLGGFDLRAGSGFSLPLTADAGGTVRIAGGAQLFASCRYAQHLVPQRSDVLLRTGLVIPLSNSFALSCEGRRALLPICATGFELNTNFYF